MAERSKALRSDRSPVHWAWVQIPLLTKFIFCNYDNYYLKYHAGPTHLRIVQYLLKSLILVSIVFCNYDNYCLQYYAGSTHLSRIIKLPVFWAWVQIPLVTKFIFCNYDNYCQKCHAGPTHHTNPSQVVDSRYYSGESRWTSGLRRFVKSAVQFSGRGFKSLF